MGLKIYVASSWRNFKQGKVVKRLRDEGHQVYDFKQPRPNENGFAWESIDTNWQNWTVKEYVAALDHPAARKGFKLDMDAMVDADVCVLVLPCGRSAHLECGWMVGSGKRTIVLTGEDEEPELMAKMCDLITDDMDVVCDYLKVIEKELILTGALGGDREPDKT